MTTNANQGGNNAYETIPDGPALPLPHETKTKGSYPI
jgi:hypothetical protein